YRRSGNNWSRVTRIASPNPTPSGFFGGTLAVYQDRFITGAVGNVQGEGRAYIYKWNGTDFTLEGTLVGNDTQQSDRFGVGVSMNSSEAVVGCLWDDDKGMDSGSAYLFTRSGSTWTQSQKITASDGDESDNFGGAVALVNDKLIAAASTDEDFGSFAGSAYEFSKNGNSWSETNKIGSPDANQNEGFGRVISSSGKTVAFAASGDDALGTFMGAVFVLDLNASNAIELQKLANSVDVFPNPATDVVNVKVNGLEGYNSSKEINFRIVDTTGKIVQTGIMNEVINQINISALPNGNYVLEMDYNGYSFGKQIIK
ncbi:MAG: T9SS type A sorting domain-containing protein, partial [Saprospiraceae bacterium]|nr:T9SS type A sorting domain-containing protein [Saprospiraceae bacterium]